MSKLDHGRRLYPVWSWSLKRCGCYRVNKQTDRQTDRHTQNDTHNRPTSLPKSEGFRQLTNWQKGVKTTSFTFGGGGNKSLGCHQWKTLKTTALLHCSWQKGRPPHTCASATINLAQHHAYANMYYKITILIYPPFYSLGKFHNYTLPVKSFRTPPFFQFLLFSVY